MKHIIIVLISVIVIFSNNLLWAQEPVNLSLIGSLDFEGGVNEVSVDGDIAALATGNILRIVDISDYDHPEMFGSLDLECEIWEVAIQGSTVFLTLRERGMSIIDISDPRNPEEIQLIELERFNQWGAIIVVDEVAYVMSYDNYLLIYDVSDPGEPELLSSIGGHFYDFSLTGEFLYLIVSLQDLAVYDISDLEEPNLVETIAIQGSSRFVDSKGSNVEIIYSHRGYALWDVSDPAHPTPGGTVEVPLYAENVYSGDDYSFVSTFRGLQLISLRYFDRPLRAGEFPAEQFNHGVDIVDDIAFYGDSEGLKIIQNDLMNSDFPELFVHDFHVDFPLTDVDDVSTVELTLENINEVVLTVEGLRFGGQDPGFFYADVDVPFDIEAGAQYDLTITFAPRWDGERFADLTIISNDLIAPEFTITLAGEGRNGREDRRIRVPEDFETICAAVEAAADCDTVVLAAGVYTGEDNINVIADRRISLMSEAGADECIIDCEESQGTHCIWFNAGCDYLAGIGFRSSRDGAVFILNQIEDEDLPVLVEECRFNDNYRSMGRNYYAGGLTIYYSQGAVVRDCIFTGNTGRDGGGLTLMFRGNSIVEDCVFLNNHGLYGGGAAFRVEGITVRNCIFSGNLADEYAGGAYNIRTCRDVLYEFCTVINNRSSLYGGIAFAGETNGEVRNCLVWGNMSDDSTDVARFGEGGHWDIHHNCIQYGLQGEENVEEDPLLINFYEPIWGTGVGFVDPESPVINAGFGTVEEGGMNGLTVSTDLVPDEGRVDIGYHRNPELYQRGGLITGEVTDALTGNPIAGAEIETTMGRSTISSEEGLFRIEYAIPGLFDLSVSCEDYYDSTLTEVRLNPNDTLHFEVALLQTRIQIEPEELMVSVNQGEEGMAEVIISNPGTAALEYRIDYQITDSDIHTWQRVAMIDVIDWLFDHTTAAITLSDDAWYLALDSEDERHQICMIDRESGAYNLVEQPVDTERGFQSIALYEGRLWGVTGNEVFQMSLDGELLSSFSLEGNPLEGITIDDDSRIWLVDASGNFTRVDFNGDRIDSFSLDLENCLGLGYRSRDSNGMYLTVFYQGRGTAIARINPQSHEMEFVRDRRGSVGQCFSAMYSDLYSNYFDIAALLSVDAENFGGFIDVFAWDIVDQWIEMDTDSGSVEPGEETDLRFFFQAENLRPGIYEADLIFSHNAPGGMDTLSTIFEVTDGNAVSEPQLPIPTQYSLDAIYPNPFNSTTTIGYSLPVAGIVSLAVYDLSGREVARLAVGAKPAGTHEAVWVADGVASGVYVVKLAAGEKVAMRKVLLVK